MHIAFSLFFFTLYALPQQQKICPCHWYFKYDAL